MPAKVEFTLALPGPVDSVRASGVNSPLVLAEVGREGRRAPTRSALPYQSVRSRSMDFGQVGCEPAQVLAAL